MDNYQRLSLYFKEIFSEVDYFLFNSSVSESVYAEHLQEKMGSILPVTLSSIIDKRKHKTFDNNNIRLAFIGSTAPYKGYPLLENTLLELLNEDISNWTLSVWGGRKAQHPLIPSIIFKGKYSPDDLEEIYDETDLLIVPSICKETFSLITLEALSFGIPVLVSSTVGAQDIVKQYDQSFIFKTKGDLKEKLRLFLSDTLHLSTFNSQILNKPWLYDYESHVNQVQLIYEKLRNKNI